MSIARIGNNQYDKLSDAATAVQDGQTIEVLRSGQGVDVPAPLTKPGKFKVIGTKDAKGAIPKLLIDMYTRPAYGKAVLDLEDGAYEIANLHIEGCAVPDSNGAAIRINSTAEDVYVHHVHLVDNENGILTGGGTATLLLEDSILERNGKAMDTSRRGYSHNIYNGNMQRFVANRVSFLNSQYGHDLKTRALYNELNQVLCSGAAAGRALDMPNGGVLHATDCKFEKPASASQNNLVDIGAEGITAGIKQEYVLTNCHFHNDVDPARDVQFIYNRSSVEVVLVDPLFTGAAAAKDRKQTLKGNIRIVLTGGPLGPRVPVGGNPGATSEQEIPQPGQVTTNPTPAPTPTPTPTPAPTVPATSITIIGNPGDGTWTKLGGEGVTVTVPENTVVRYGANGKYVYAKVSGKFTIGNTFFKTDPINGFVKTAETWTAAGGSTTPTPTPAPTPTPTPTPAPTGNGDIAAAFGTFLSGLSGKTVTVTIEVK